MIKIKTKILATNTNKNTKTHISRIESERYILYPKIARQIFEYYLKEPIVDKS